ncbi:MAG: hypothetical protein NC218_08085 [Acetobacter sp.]|nr:hypothetical protein [Acetobacter sp.]
MEPISLKALRKTIATSAYKDGLLFCFGSSFISRLIQAKTKLYPEEIVPSHVAMLFNGHIYESTSGSEKVRGKTIPAGVRRWLLDDFYKVEHKKETTYVYVPCPLDEATLDAHIHKPYGKDAIVDYLLADKSKGSAKGLICSQYANLCAGYIDSPCCTPAELYRTVLNELGRNNKQ